MWMQERDYIVRLIKEIARTLARLLFHVDIDAPAAELALPEEDRVLLYSLLDMADAGRINEAENRLFETADPSDRSGLETALLFYARLNDKTDEFLRANGFSREEILSGMKDVAVLYGVDGLAGF